MARRRSFMATRMSKMKGIPRNEKEILVSVGQIVDNAVNNRTPTNPTGTIRKAGKNDPRLPPVKNISANSGVRSAKLTWDPVDGSILENYAITFTNLNTGETTEGISYTSSFTFKGESGNYKAQIKPIGRNGVAAPIRTIVFTVQDSIMILEGAKNGTSTESPFVSEVVLTPRDYKVFVWTSFVLNSFSVPTQNNAPRVQLRYGDALESSTLIQEIEMFPESETLTNLDDLSYELIFRPDGASPNRTGNFETSNTVMFAPFDVPESLADQSTRFWISVTNREAEADVISCSIVIWVGSGGRGEITVTPPTPPVVVINPSSIDLDGSLEFLSGKMDKNSGELEDEFSIAFWVKPFKVNGTPSVDDQSFFSLTTVTGSLENFIHVKLAPAPAGSNPSQGSFGFVVRNTTGVQEMGYNIVAIPDGINFNNNVLQFFTNGADNWNFVVGTWKRSLIGTQRMKFYMNGVVFVTGGTIIVDTSTLLGPDLARDLTGPADDPALTIGLVPALTDTDNPEARYFSIGVWSNMLTAAEVLALYNAGGNSDWREDSGDYVSSANLQHYFLLGADTTTDQTITKEYGNSAYPVNMNDTTIVPVGLITVADDVVEDAPV